MTPVVYTPEPLRNTRYTFFRACCLCAALFLFTITGCVNDVNEVNRTTQLAEPGVEYGKNIELFYSEFGQVKVRITAPAVTRYLSGDPYTEFTEGLRVEFYDEHMQVSTWLTANYGVRYESQGRTVLKNDVQVLNEKKEYLNTEELIWDEKRHIIFSEKFVKITTPDQVIYGEGMEADEQLTKYVIKKPQGVVDKPVE
ncbi:MAG TPA: LPS export ABC transporter periplasmic protein LptC [Chitinophagales bacterium]|nr:LPS export ABC transporter periplasmic protein LptC [Chitinophagales bacterium]